MTSPFKKNLIDSDDQTPADAPARVRYEKQLAALFESAITPALKSGLIFGALTGVATVILCGSILAVHRPNPPVLIEAMSLGIVFGIAAAVFCVRVLMRGTYRRRSDATFYAGLIWGFTVLMQVAFMQADSLHPQSAPRFTAFGLVFLIGASVILLRTVIEQSELRTREKLLEIQLEIAEMKQIAGK
jgi:hypothetical protein